MSSSHHTLNSTTRKLALGQPHRRPRATICNLNFGSAHSSSFWPRNTSFLACENVDNLEVFSLNFVREVVIVAVIGGSCSVIHAVALLRLYILNLAIY